MNDQMDSVLLHYEEYGNNDYLAEISANTIVSYFQEIGYTREKANIIVGAFEKTEFVGTNGFGRLFSEDERFYKFAKEYFRRKAELKFGFDGYLLGYVTSDGYCEFVVPSYIEANKVFDKMKKEAIPVCLYRHNDTRGWRKDPIRANNYRKVQRFFVMKHIKGRKK